MKMLLFNDRATPDDVPRVFRDRLTCCKHVIEGWIVDRLKSRSLCVVSFI